MDYEERGKKQDCISGVNTRTYAKLKEKARKVVTTVKGGKVERWHGKRESEKTHQARCPNNERE